MKKLSILFLFILVVFISIFANVAMPGIYYAGGSVGLFRLDKNEIKDFKKIYLDSEKIKVLLFKGHSYVKASYNFKNITDKNIELIMGYPVDVITTYNGGKIDFKSLRYLEIYINKKKIKTNFYEIKNSDELINDNIKVNLKYNYNKWYIFKVNFKKDNTTEITLYYTVDTTNAVLIKGYKREKRSCFAYAFDTGKMWAYPIKKALFYLKLMDNLKFEDLKIIEPLNSFSMINHSMFLEYSNFIPDVKNNIVIFYYKKIKDYDFEEKTRNYKYYYNRLDMYNENM